MQVTGDAKLIRDCGELDEVIATIKAAGKDPKQFDFEVRRLKEGTGSDGLYPIRYAVLVTNRKSGKGATLAGGDGEAWVERLAEKLRAGKFG
jgi:hypothetical protein